MKTKPAVRATVDLINAYSELCPTQYDKDHIRKMVADMRKEREPQLAVCRAITASLYDGLAYGNWPSALREPGDKW
jgi:hypothetical protein